MHRVFREGAVLVGYLIAVVIVLVTKPFVVSGSDGPRVPDAVCASCHRAIYERYRTTPMGNASGMATEGFLPADFTHSVSGVHYKIDQEQGRVWLHFDRDDPARLLSGKRELRYFIGSGKRGRTYLFEERGYWFEAPINWYGKKQLWDMAPNYQSAKEMPLTLPVDPGCLHCHASSVAPSLPGARNHFATAPFAQDGITCEACHGDGASHVATNGKSAMLNPDRLDPIRRDSVCLNCHLEGQVAVNRIGRQPNDFKPGDNLFDFTVFFIYSGEVGSGGRATSQWEALLKSECMKRSNGRMGCTTCHDPHGSPGAGQRVAFYRLKCLQCHNSAGFTQNHHPEEQDCTACHMARPPSNDIAHEQLTDHWIRKRVNQERLPLAASGELVTVGGIPASERELGLAYAQMAARGDSHADAKAKELLRHSEKANSAQDDTELHSELGFLEQVDGDTKDAVTEYDEALQADPFDALADGNLAVIDAKQHRLGEALRRWRMVFDHDPSQLAAGMNLAISECSEGEKAEALNTLDDILVFSPDDGRARGFSEEIETGKEQCTGR